MPKATPTGDEPPLRICNKCGKAYFAATREYVAREVQDFGAYILAQPPSIQADYGLGPQSSNQQTWSPEWHAAKYERCQCGNSYTDFRDATPSDMRRISPLASQQGILVD